MASTWQEAEEQKLKNWIPSGKGHGIGIQNGKRQAFRFGKPVPNWTVPIQDLLIENPVGLAKGTANLTGNILRTVLGLPSQKEIERATELRNKRVNNNQSVAELPPAEKQSNFKTNSKGEVVNVWTGEVVTPTDAANKAELLKKRPSIADKVSEETPNSSDPPSSGSTVFTKNKEGEALGVLTGNQRKQWEAANPGWQKWQPEGKGYTMSSVLKNDGSIVDTKAIKELPKDLNFGGKQALNVAKLPKGIDLNKGAEMFNPNNIKNMPSFAESMKMNNAADGTAGVGGAAALKIASMLLNAFNKKKGGGYVKEAGGGSIEKSIVTPNMNFDEFGTLPS